MSDVYSRFWKLLTKKNMKVADITRETGIKSTVFSEWKKGKSQPNADKLLKIARCLDVSMEYLLSGESEKDRIAPPYESDAEFMSYIYRFWALSPEYREDIYKAIRHAERDMEDTQAEKAKKEKAMA